jgi:hypothetical protein
MDNELIRGQVTFTLYGNNKPATVEFTGDANANDIPNMIYTLRMGFSTYLRTKGQREQKAVKSA